MSFKATLLAATIAALPSLAGAHMVIEDAYARASSPLAQSGAAFLTIFNHSDRDDRLIGVTSTAAERLELHTHIMEDNGLMRMVEAEEGFAIASGETIALERGGMHVMLLGLTAPLVQGEEIEITFTFEHAEPVTHIVIIDNARQPGMGGTGGMEMDHGAGHTGPGSDG